MEIVKRDKIIHKGAEYDNYYIVERKKYFSKELPDGREIFYDDEGNEFADMT